MVLTLAPLTMRCARAAAGPTVAHPARPGDAGRRAGAVASGGAALVSGDRPAAGRRRLRRCRGRAAKRFGGQIVGEKPGATATTPAAPPRPKCPPSPRWPSTMMIVADERGDFGEYFPYRTWLPRPVAGTQGLVATGWHASEQWGVVQLQNCFRAYAKRPMRGGLCRLGGGAQCGRGCPRAPVGRRQGVARLYPQPGIELAALRAAAELSRLNGELRQPMLIAQPRAFGQPPVAARGILHPSSDLDTLGFDAPEVKCKP